MTVPVDFLNTVINISLVFATLASLITLFKTGDKFNEGDIYDFRGIILSCLLLALGALFTILISYALDARSVWALSSFLFFVIVSALQIQLELLISSKKYVVWTYISAPLRILTSLTSIISLINALVWQQGFIFLVGMFIVLAVVALRFYIFLMSVTNAYSLPEAYKRRPPTPNKD